MATAAICIALHTFQHIIIENARPADCDQRGRLLFNTCPSRMSALQCIHEGMGGAGSAWAPDTQVSLHSSPLLFNTYSSRISALQCIHGDVEDAGSAWIHRDLMSLHPSLRCNAHMRVWRTQALPGPTAALCPCIQVCSLRITHRDRPQVAQGEA